MKNLWFGPGLLALCFLVCSDQAGGCEWDQSVSKTQGLDPLALNTLRLGDAVPMDLETCRSSCCNRADCDLVVVLYPQDTRAQCVLVKCWFQGRDQCVLQQRNDSQSELYRKKVDPATRSAQSGAEDTRHVVPLVFEPRAVEVNQTNDSICRQQMKVGPCRAAFPKFFYNVTEQRCSSFMYGGCEGNGNSFNSLEDCETTCSGVTGPVLLDDPAPAASEPSAKAPRRAPVLDSESSAQQVAELCNARPEPGPCRAAFPRWFYNHQTGTCETFIYGGCGGNGNNHDSKDACLATCTGHFDSHGEDRSEKTAAFFLFITLAFISALVLMALIIVSVRRRRRSRRSSVSDKQELLPEDKHSSLESLSIPDSPRPDKA